MALADSRREGTLVQARSAFSSIVVGGLLMAASGLALAAPPASAASPTSTASAPPQTAPPPSRTAAASPAAAPAADALPPGQVWACVRNGQHVFSDKRCGPDASIRQLSALNTMSTPALPPQRPVGMPPPAYYPDEGYAEDYGAEQDGDTAGVSGAPIGYYGVLRRPARHSHRPPPRHHVQPHATPAARGSSVTRGH
ncbi:MAG TPA: hypothetical protein VHZ53_20765 [Steroidobacteraceae bacterium]|jgi:hypothetical protein|nr:hypothetical protein [Steroidobacteraceae bacterium]